ncbi:MAG: hypothetical protein ACLTVY_11825 [Faecalibacterium sp.]
MTSETNTTRFALSVTSASRLGIGQRPDAGVQHQPDQLAGLMADLRREDAVHRHHQNAKLHGAEDAEQEERQCIKAAPE